MIRLILIANFPMGKTGIYTTADGLFQHVDQSKFIVYSNDVLCVGGLTSLPLNELITNHDDKVIIFTHFECFLLRGYVKRFPKAVIHVGDWPGRYWESVSKHKNVLKGFFGKLRVRFRSMYIPKSTKLLFVTQEDTQAAVCAGYRNSDTLYIGVNSPSETMTVALPSKEIVFTGNFRYEPNYLAGLELLDFAIKNSDYVVHLAGYHSDRFDLIRSPNFVTHNNVLSVVDFLAAKRRVYVSLVRVGAGAKNKILEALIAGCPIIATTESLDNSLRSQSTIRVINSCNNISTLIDQVILEENRTNEALAAAERIAVERSWLGLSGQLEALIHEN